MKCKLAPISAFGKIVTGKTPDTKNKSYIGDKYLFITPNELHDGFMIDSTERKLSVEGLESIVNNTVKQGIHILVGCIGWDMGNVGIVEGKCAFNQQINAITDISDGYNPYYIYYLLSGKKELFRKVAGVTRTPILNKSSFENIEVPVLEKKEQDKIAWLLKSIDEKINVNKKQINTLESMAKTLYDYWFVQFDFPDANGRPYKTSGGKMEWNETLSREIPKGWESDLAGVLIKNITNGLNPRKNFKLNVGGNIDYLTVKNLTKSGLIDWSNCDKITDDDKKIVSKRSDLRRGDILLASISPLGRCYYITETPSTWDINESVFSVRSNSEKCTSEYLYSFLTSELFIKQLENNSTGSIFKGIRVEALKLMPIVVPPIKVIERYSRIVKKYYYAKEKLANENIRLAQLRDYLLPMLMNGQVTFRQ